MKVTDFLLLSCQSHLAEDLTQQLFIVLLQAFLRTLATTENLDKFADEVALKVVPDNVPNKPACNATCAVGKIGCFAAGTKVLHKLGAKNIELVAEGDSLLSYDHTQQKTKLMPVTNVFRRWVNVAMILTLSNGERIYTTPEHPFYTKQQYVECQ